MTTSLVARRALAATARRVSGKEFTTLAVDLEFPGLPSLKPEPAKATTASVSTLPNGLVVVTEGSSTTSTVTLTYPKAGSSNELIDEVGAALVNKCLAFKSGSGMSSLLINRTIEDAGGRPHATADRTKATLGYTVAPESAARLVPLLATDCSMEKWDVRDAKIEAAYECEVAASSAQIVLTESLYSAAYGSTSIGGRPFYAADPSTDAIIAFRDRNYGIKGAVLAATGIKDHSSFCTEISELLADAPVGTSEGSAGMTYVGGESRISSSSSYAHIALAFKGPESAIVTSVMKSLFTVLGAESGVAGFAGDGIVGLYAGSSAPGGIVDSMCTILTSVIGADVIKRARGLAKAEALFALDGGSASLAAAMTSSVLQTGGFINAADLAKAYDAVTDDQVLNTLKAMRSSNPSLAAIGDLNSVPYHATVVSRLS